MRSRILATAALVLLLSSVAFARDVSIGVLALFHPKQLTVAGSRRSWVVVSGCGWNMILDPDRGGAVLSPVGDDVKVTSRGRSERCKTVTVASRQGTPTVFEYGVPGKIHRVYRGIGSISADRGELVPVVRMDLEVAVSSVIAAEQKGSIPLEALKAQAIATRSYFVAAKTAHLGFDFCDTTHCQFLREPPDEATAAARAARDTDSMVLHYSGEAIAAMYSASCGGRTRTLEQIGVKSKGYPYFSAECPYCRTNAVQWRRHAQPPRTERERLAIGRREGWSEIPGNNYRVVSSSGGTLLEGYGVGHGVGLCQAGAAAMAREGKSFEQILLYYFPNTTLASLTDSP